MRKEKKRSPRSGKGNKPNIWLTILLCLGGVIMVFPFLWMILSAFKTASDV